MASFRAGKTTTAPSTSEITVDLPVGTVAGDLLVMYVTKPNTDRPVVPLGWFLLGDHDHGTGKRLTAMACWTVATAAMVAAGDVDVVCTTSTNDSSMHAVALAFDISDWPGFLWNSTLVFVHGAAGTTLASNSLATIFEGGISLVFHAVGGPARDDVGTTTEGGTAVDTDDTALISARVWYNVAETAELAQASTVGGTGTQDRTKTGFACFGPSASTDGIPCEDFDGIRVAL